MSENEFLASILKKIRDSGLPQFVQIQRLTRLKGEAWVKRTMNEAKNKYYEERPKTLDGRRRRTMSGVFFRLVYEQLTPEERKRVFLKKGTKRKLKLKTLENKRRYNQKGGRKQTYPDRTFKYKG